DYAIAQKKPVGPRRTLIVGMSLLLALCCGIGLAFLIEYLDDTVRSVEDIENFLHLPSVALIPQVAAPKPKRRLAANGNKGALASINGNGSQEVLLRDVDSRSPLSEAYRQLRTSIL